MRIVNPLPLHWLQLAPLNGKSARIVQSSEEFHMIEIVLTVNNKDGLHARPAKDFIKKTREFTSTVSIQNLSRPDSKEVGVTPVNLLNIAVRQGHQIRLRAEGADEAEAIAGLKQLIESSFGE
jgi:phosphocarrier protein HPr